MGSLVETSLRCPKFPVAVLESKTRHLLQSSYFDTDCFGS